MGNNFSAIGGESLRVTDDVYNRASRRNSEVGDESCARVGRKYTLRTVPKNVYAEESETRLNRPITAKSQVQEQEQAPGGGQAHGGGQLLPETSSLLCSRTWIGKQTATYAAPRFTFAKKLE